MADQTPVVIQCEGTCTVTHVIAQEPYTLERMQGDLAIYGLCLAFLATVWGVKQLLNIFRTGRDES